MVLARMRACLRWKQRIHTFSFLMSSFTLYSLCYPQGGCYPYLPTGFIKNAAAVRVSGHTGGERLWVSNQSSSLEVLSLGKQAYPVATASPLKTPGSRRWPLRLLPSISMCSAAHSRSTLYGPWTAGRRLLCPWEFLSKNAGVVAISFSRGSS